MDAVIAVLIVVVAIAAAGRALNVWCSFVRVIGLFCYRPVRNVRFLTRLQSLPGWTGIPRGVCAVAVGLVIVITLFGWNIASIPAWVAAISFGIVSLMIFLGGIGEGVALNWPVVPSATEAIAVSPLGEPTDTSDCAACGARLGDGARFCQECGTMARIPSPLPIQSSSSDRS